MVNPTNKKHSYPKLLLAGLLISTIKALFFAFVLSLVPKVLWRILHEDFYPMFKHILNSEELYQDMQVMAVIWFILSLPETFYLASKYYHSKENEYE
jgi:hypothetical protein